MGKIYLEGKYAEKNLKESYKYYKKSESHGDDEGIYRIGCFLEVFVSFYISLEMLSTIR